jgi:hypothetical protein
LEPDVEEERPVTPPAPVAPAAPVADPIFIATPEPLSAVRKRITTDRPPSSLSALPLVDRQVLIVILPLASHWSKPQRFQTSKYSKNSKSMYFDIISGYTDTTT